MKKGDVVGIVKLKNEFDGYVFMILGEHLEQELGRKRGAPRRFKVVKDLPSKEEYLQLKAKKYTTTVESLIDSARMDIESLCEELREWHDNLPESFRDGDKGSQLEDAISELESVDPPDPPDMKGVDQSVVYYPDLDADSRSARAAEAASALRAAAEHLRMKAEELQNQDDKNDLSDEISGFADDLESSADSIDGVEFPGMY